MNEAAIGKSLKKIFENGKVKREEMFIVTKLPNIANDAKYVEDYIKRSLSALQLDYIDLYLIHHPVGFVNGEDLMPKDENGKVKLDMSTDHIAIWKKMEEQVDAGRAKAIGLSNFNIKQIERIIGSARIKPANLQIEAHLYCQQKELHEFCKKNGITVCAYSPLGSPNLMPMLPMFGGDPSSIPQLNPLTDPVVLEIAKAHDKTSAQVLLRHLLQKNFAVIPKSSNPERIKQNFQVFDFELSEKEMGDLDALDRANDGRLFKSTLFSGADKHPECPY
ncbi:aldose reductase-related protein 2-like isoform X2 [Nilaparvata lugens]|nr:aldose reductase-related protein 2-like isoform X2 [Nilaparvata lugens]